MPAALMAHTYTGLYTGILDIPGVENSCDRCSEKAWDVRDSSGSPTPRAVRAGLRVLLEVVIIPLEDVLGGRRQRRRRAAMVCG